MPRPHGTGTLIERGGKLLAQWRATLPDGTAKRLTKTFPKGTTKTDAQNWLKQHVGGVAEQAAPSQRKKQITFGELAGRYIANVLEPCLVKTVGGERQETARMSDHCARSYTAVLHHHLLPRWGNIQLAAFNQPETRQEVEEWFRSLWRSTTNPNGFAPKTVRGHYNVMKLVFKHGVKWGDLEINPLTEGRVELPKGSTKRLKHPITLTVAQFFALMELLPLMERTAVAFAGWLGPRISEAFGLQWGDLDLTKGEVAFRRGFVNGRFTPLKTEASRTSLPIPPSLVELLRDWKAQSLYNKPTDFVFASPYTNGARPLWPQQMMKTHIKPVMKAAGLPSVGWHAFRHSMVSWAKAGGLGIEEAKTLARHETSATTSNIYGPLELGAKRKAQERLAEYMVGQRAASVQ